MTHLIRSGRAVLLLDGYDEMAQFMNARERRACLGALADLASDGARGLLTSRPNYFTEVEELNVFEMLYRSLEQNRHFIFKSEKEYIESERSVDKLLERYILQRHERYLQDLTPDQTKSLVKRKLHSDPRGQEIVLSILDRVFRQEIAGAKQALSGKPVIISYLLELVDELRAANDSYNFTDLTEWQIYKLIVDRLMFRDLQRAPTIHPDVRRGALQQLAIALSGRDQLVADEALFMKIIEKEFAADLRALPTEERRSRRNELFEDLRSSATLTRVAEVGGEGWAFSHNSLREFLVAECMLSALFDRDPFMVSVPITEAMRGFAASISAEDAGTLWSRLAELWPQRSQVQLGPYVGLLWESAARSDGGLLARLKELGTSAGHGIDLGYIEAKDLSLCQASAEKVRLDATSSVFTNADFSGMDLSGSQFSSAVLDSCSFSDCDLSEANFSQALVFECNFSGAILTGADFREADQDITIKVLDNASNIALLTGKDALGFIKLNGGITDPLPLINIYMHHVRYPIIYKILEKVSEQKNSQLLGLTQRGEAHRDPPFARDFVERLVGLGWLTIGRNDLVSVTPTGRPVVQRVVQRIELPSEIAEILVS